jgi:hypothetical protein
MDADRARSALGYIAHLHIDLARHSLSAAQRAESLRWLLGGWRAAHSRRWWVTACMVMFWPGTVVGSFMERRQQLAQEPLTRLAVEQPDLAATASAPSLLQSYST